MDWRRAVALDARGAGRVARQVHRRASWEILGLGLSRAPRRVGRGRGDAHAARARRREHARDT